MHVTLAGLTGDGPVECSRGVRIVPDVALGQGDLAAADYDAVVLPGGMKGAQAFASVRHGDKPGDALPASADERHAPRQRASAAGSLNMCMPC